MRRGAIAIAVSSAVVAAALLYWLLRPAPSPPWLVGMRAGWRPFPAKDPPFLTADAAATCRRITDDIQFRPFWGVSEVEQLERIIIAGFPSWPLTKASTRQELSAYFAFSSAMLALCLRIETNAPMSPEARERVVNLLRREMYEAVPMRRSDGASALITSGQIESPEIRAEVERLLKDEDDDVAQTVHRRLAEYDRLKARKKILEDRGGGT